MMVVTCFDLAQGPAQAGFLLNGLHQDMNFEESPVRIYPERSRKKLTKITFHYFSLKRNTASCSERCKKIDSSAPSSYAKVPPPNRT